MTGLAPFVPGLLGLPRDYLNAQLGAWRSGQRRALPPDCMAQVAQRAVARGHRRGLGLARGAAGSRACGRAAGAVHAAADRLRRRRRSGRRRERTDAMKLGKASIALAVVAAIVLLAAIAVVGLNRDDDAAARAR